MRPDPVYHQQPSYEKSAYSASGTEDEDPPLLEGKPSPEISFSDSLDLDIDLKQISQRIVSVMSFRGVNKEIIEDADMAGPAIVAIIFGFLLLLVSAKLLTNSEERSPLATSTGSA